MSNPAQVLAPAAAARAAIRADLALIDGAQNRLRGADTDVVGNAFRVEIAEHLETSTESTVACPTASSARSPIRPMAPTTRDCPPTPRSPTYCGRACASLGRRFGAGSASRPEYGRGAT
ncbi:hypothetical protein MMIN_32250 [Mycolicibacter minnesotensis]|nr:hypothetical protein MMIN_32250 [Mycolicibacter minnesotensis]